MKLPKLLAEEFQQKRGHAPLVAVRSMYDLQGALGETYVAADAEGAVLFGRTIGGSRETRVLAWSEVRQATVQTEQVFAFLELHLPTGPVRLQFSGWDAPRLRQVVELWRAHQAPAATTTSAALAAPAIAVSPPPQFLPAVTPLAAFCAGIHAMIECDGRLEPAELNFLSQRIPDAKAILEGHQFLRQHGINTLCQCVNAVLNDAQKRCLWANLVAVAMVDGLLQSTEQELLERFQSALTIPEEEKQTVFEVLMAKNNLAVFASDEGAAALADSDGLTPLMAYCAALRAMMEADQDRSPREEELLVSTVPYPEDIRLGQDYLQAYDVDHLLGRLASVLNHSQRLCLAANLIALAMVDGVIHGSEQELLHRFQQAMELSDADYVRLYGTLLLKNSFSIFGS